jgi:hypothetical protein
MSNPTQEVRFTDDQRQVVKQLNRRHTYGFFFALFAVTFVEVIGSESDQFLHMLDDIIIVSASAIAIVVIVVMWKKHSLPQLKMTNNVLFALAIVFTLSAVFAVMVESGDPTDLGDDIPKLFISVALLLNRFV